MATTPEDIQQQPKIAQRVIEKLSAPVSDSSSRQRLVLVVAGAAATQAPQPFAALLGALLIVLAYDRKR